MVIRVVSNEGLLMSLHFFLQDIRVKAMAYVEMLYIMVQPDIDGIAICIPAVHCSFSHCPHNPSVASWELLWSFHPQYVTSLFSWFVSCRQVYDVVKEETNQQELLFQTCSCFLFKPSLRLRSVLLNKNFSKLKTFNFGR